LNATGIGIKIPSMVFSLAIIAPFGNGTGLFAVAIPQWAQEFHSPKAAEPQADGNTLTMDRFHEPTLAPGTRNKARLVVPAWIAGIPGSQDRPETSMSTWIPALHAGMAQ
jgi:hypothetical protein